MFFNDYAESSVKSLMLRVFSNYLVYLIGFSFNFTHTLSLFQAHTYVSMMKERDKNKEEYSMF